MFVHVVLEGFAAIDEDDGDLVGELAAELVVGVHVDFLPVEAAAAVELGQSFFDDLAEMATPAGVEHDLARVGHGASLARHKPQRTKPLTTGGTGVHRGNTEENRGTIR